MTNHHCAPGYWLRLDGERRVYPHPYQESEIEPEG